ncbi:hypothetical protein [Paenibacillus wenxiniae]|uniref:Beta/Gamma crystallin n=1 Tax=Paenibacillus wenxiniae TaxID=1636843 RepID=A0ABW4RE49_9BACL
MQNVAKFALSIVLFAVSIPSLSVKAEEVQSSPDYSQYIKEAIEQEILLDRGAPASSKGISKLNDSQFNLAVDNIEATPSVTTATKQKIAQLENANVVVMDMNENGELVSATSSKDGDIKSNFEEVTTATQTTYNDYSNATVTNLTYGLVATNKLGFTTQALISNQGNTSGKETGAFHRLQTPASSAKAIYNGVVADSIVLPTYNIEGATNLGETAYMYTGVDDFAEVGFESVKSQSTPTGWYPFFHAKADHSIASGDDNGYKPSSNVTYVDRSKKFVNGATVSGYKVYYYSTDSTLTIREQINYSDIYVVRFTGKTSVGRSVKRLTAIAMNGNPPVNAPFHYGFTTPVVWNNMRFLTNNSASSVYPSSVASLNNDVWVHGGKINYMNNTSSHTEQYTFSVN